MEKDMFLGVSMLAAIPSAIIAVRTNKMLHKKLPDLRSYIWWHFFGVQLILTSIVFTPMVFSAASQGSITTAVCLISLVIIVVSLAAGISIVLGSKWGWIIGSIITFNPLLWLVNFLYYRCRANELSKFLAYKRGQDVEKVQIEKAAKIDEPQEPAAQARSTIRTETVPGKPFYKKYKTGFFRLWLLLSAGWVAYIGYDRSDAIDYTITYLTNRKSLVAEVREKSVRELEKLEYDESQRVKDENETNNRFKKLGLPVVKPKNDIFSDESMFKVAKARLEREIATPRPTPPDYSWIFQMAFAPVVVPLALSLLFMVVWKLGGWIVDGFRQKS